MIETVDVTLEGTSVGTVTVEEQGLYYCFCCRCKLLDRRQVRLFADQQDLGILIPEGEYFCLTTKVPKKRFLRKNISFHLAESGAAEDIVLMSVSVDSAFPGIDCLEYAKFVRTSGGPAIRFPVKYFHPVEEDHLRAL